MNRILRFLPARPSPVETRACSLRIAGKAATAIYRRWRPGKAAECRLCASCSAYDDACLVLVGRRVSSSEARHFSTVGMEKQGGGA